MDFEVWLLFVITETVLCLSPGPAVVLVFTMGLTRGARAGFLSLAGILVANLMYFVVSGTSLGAILVSSWKVFFLIKWVGAAYLIWIGLQMLTSKKQEQLASPEEAPDFRSGRKTFLHGFVTQGANPKAILYFSALLPQFIDPSRPVGIQILILTSTSVVIEFIVLCGYAMLADRVSLYLQKPTLRKAVFQIGGLLLMCAGAGFATMGQG